MSSEQKATALSDDDRLEEAILSYYQSMEAGLVPDRKEFLSRYPGLTPHLEQFLAGQQHLNSILSPLQGVALATEPGVRNFGDYEVLEELGKGGIGVVFRGRDLDLGRCLAVKVLRQEYRGNAAMVRRFVEEAQIGSQLQHPGIVPIYAKGRLPDSRPYFTMKLVNGETLAELLRRRTGPAADLPRFLGIFGQVCQTLAYSHSRGVIHRDLKPANIMVGAFGEVQVMDWGLAKVLAGGPLAEQASAQDTPDPSPMPTIETVAERSTPGAVMGTLAYMPPEQAQGKIQELDRRCDVFGLGAILCEILTGQPPYVGRSNDIFVMVQHGNLAEAITRLDGCGADVDVVNLTKGCLAADPAKRPANAGALADALAVYQTGVQERLRAAELARATAEVERAAAQAKAQEERKRRRVTLGLAAAVLLLVVGAGAVVSWYREVQAARTAEANQRRMDAERKHALDEQGIRDALAQADKSRNDLHAQLKKPNGVFDLLNKPAAWVAMIQTARTAWQRAQDIATGASQKIDSQLVAQIAELDRLLSVDDADRQLALRLDNIREDWSLILKGKFNYAGAARDYAETFADVGYEPAPGREGSIARRIDQSAIRDCLVAALDDWAYVAHATNQFDLCEQILEIARLADPDPWRDQVRDRRVWQDARAKDKLAEKALRENRLEQLSPHMLALVGTLLGGTADHAERWAIEAQQLYPGHFWMNMNLGNSLARKNPVQAAGFFRVAVGLRPTSVAAWTNLGGSLRDQKDLPGAIAAWKKAREFDPNDARRWNTLGSTMHDQKDLPAAIDAYKKALEFDPKYADAWNNLGLVLYDQKDLPAAIAAWKKAVECNPKHAGAWNNLGNALHDLKDEHGAMKAYKKALEGEPKLAESWTNLGHALRDQKHLPAAIAAYKKALEFAPERPGAWNDLANALRDQKELPAAIDAYNKAVELDPKHAVAWTNLGGALAAQRNLPAAVAALNKAVESDPKYVRAWNHLGGALHAQKDLPAAIAAFNKALALDPKTAGNWYNLGLALNDQKDLPAAIAAYKKALEFDPEFAEAHCNLGHALRRQGQFTDALAALKRGHELGSKQPAWRYPSTHWIEECQRLIDLDPRLQDILKGNAEAKNAAEGLALADLCQQYKKRNAAAARFYADAFAEQPKLADDLRFPHRYDAACAAALAAAGKGSDADTLDDKERAKWRRQALEWLKADLIAWTKIVEKQREAHPVLQRRLTHWRKDADLVGLREREALANLPEEERREWQQVWADVEALLVRTKE